MIRRIVVVTSCLFLFSGWSWPQEPSGQQPSPGGGDQSGQTQDAQRPSRQRPIFLSGKVMLEDGQTPGQGVRVELVCRGNVLRHDYASGSGMFSISIDMSSQNLVQPMDASVSTSPYAEVGGITTGLGRGSNPITEQVGPDRYASLNLSDCDLRAQLAGYQSQVLPLGPRRALDNPDVGTIVLYRLDGRQGGTVSLKTLAAPKKAREAYEKAGTELIKEKPDLSRALSDLEEAVEIHPEFAAAWVMMGDIHMAEDRVPDAAEAFEKAAAADPEYVTPYASLARIALQEEQWERAAELCERALSINPEHIPAHYFNALANSSLGRIVLAEASALKVRSSGREEEYPLVLYTLGWIMAQKGEFETAASEFRRFLAMQPEGGLSERLKAQLADWQQQGLIATQQD